VQWAGGAYLIYLGYAAIAASKVDAHGMQKTEGAKPSFVTSIKNGFWVGVLNPKSIIFFAAILPAFVDQEKNNVTSQLLFLGLVFVTIAFISDSTYGILAGTVRQWLASDLGRLIFMRRFGGSVMIGLGLFTIASAILTA
jgi:threonine/homoserine/homoserine lactone efflux protein